MTINNKLPLFFLIILWYHITRGPGLMWPMDPRLDRLDRQTLGSSGLVSKVVLPVCYDTEKIMIRFNYD